MVIGEIGERRLVDHGGEEMEKLGEEELRGDAILHGELTATNEHRMLLITKKMNKKYIKRGVKRKGHR